MGKAERLAAIRRLQKTSLASACHMNTIVPELVRRISAMGLQVSAHDAYTTARTRKRLGVSKPHVPHVNDALCIYAPSALAYQSERKMVVRASGRGERQMLRPTDKHSYRRGQGYRR